MTGWWTFSYVVLWALVLLLCVVVVALARQIGTLHLRLGPRGALEVDGEGPPLGTAIEPMRRRALDGREIVVGAERQLILFSSPGCRMCEEILPALPAVGRDRGMEPVVVTDSDREETELAYAGRNGLTIVPGPEIFVAHEIPGTPFVLALDSTGIVRAKGTVNNLEQMEGLLDVARERERAGI